MPQECEEQQFYKCEKCGKSFKGANGLRYHNKKIDCSNFEFCKICDTAVKNLQKHISLVHHERQIHKCHLCEKVLASKQNLENHVSAVHEGIKKYDCEDCGKKFSQPSNLKMHIKTAHEGVKMPPELCYLCGKDFSDLKSHIINVHEVTKKPKITQNIQCESCGKSFRYHSCAYSAANLVLNRVLSRICVL